MKNWDVDETVIIGVSKFRENWENNDSSTLVTITDADGLGSTESWMKSDTEIISVSAEFGSCAITRGIIRSTHFKVEI